jgi:putative ATPase
VLDAAGLRRHDLILDLNAGTGLLTWEAIRRAPEGGVWALAGDQEAADALVSFGSALGALDAPNVLACTIVELGELMELRGEAEVRFDAIIGRNALGAHGDVVESLSRVREMLAPGGRVSLAESLPGQGSRPSDLLEPDTIDADLLERVQRAEDDAYSQAGPESKMGGAGWLDGSALLGALSDAGLDEAGVEVVMDEGLLPVTASLVERWFGDGGAYASALAGSLSEGEVATLERRFAGLVGRPSRPWRTATAFVTATGSPPNGS